MNIIAGCRVTQTLREDNRIGIYRARRESAESSAESAVDASATAPNVIIKALRAVHPSLEDVARLRHEAEIVVLLPFPGVLQVLDCVPHGNGVALLLEDFGGMSLHEWLHQNRAEGLSLDEFFPIALQLATILEQVHGRGVIHQDIKPDNLLFNAQTGQIKLSDFGIAARDAQATPGQMPGRMQGTLAYMSPEQTGRLDVSVDWRSDFYALGVTFFEILTHRVPFESEDAMELVHCHLAKTPPAPHEIVPAIPPALSALVLKLLAKTARERYQSARGLQADLRECQTQWQASRAIAKFPLGRFDRSDELPRSTRLYGREAEVQTLLRAFEAAGVGGRELVLIAGYSGIGKSSLVRELHGALRSKNALFVAGKFDQFRRNVPYASLIEAFRDLIRQALTESESDLAHFKTRLLDAVGPNGQLLVEVLPELALIIGPQPPAPPLGPQETLFRFQFVLLQFVRVWTGPAHPLVLFLDDLQWADAASLSFLQGLMLDSQCRHLLLLGAYRDNEVTPSHPLLLALDEICKAGAIPGEITLAPLDQGQVCQWLEDTLGADRAAVTPLAQLLLQRTQGNPFFLNQLLQSLHERRLIFCDDGAWNWDIAAIAEANLTGDVVELMSRKIQTLPAATQEALQFAACIGNRFDARTLSLVCEQNQAQIDADLQDALAAGLISPLGNSSSGNSPTGQEDEALFKFLHDRVQQAAYSLVEAERRPAVHLKIGRLMLENCDESGREAQLFEIVGHWNEGRSSISAPDELRQLMRLNLEAGLRAKASGAHAAALSYFSVGQEIAPPDGWDSDYETLFPLAYERSQSEYFEAHLEAAETQFGIALRRARTPLDRALVETIRVQLYVTRNDFGRAIEVGRQGLLALGLRLPREASQTQILRALLEAKRRQGRRAVAEVLHLPRMKDPRLLAQMQLLESFSLALYLGGKPQLFALVVLKMVGTSLRWGNAEHSCAGYSNYGVLLGIALGDYKTGLQFGEMAIELAQSFGSRHRESSTKHIYGSLLMCWRRPLRESVPILRGSHQMGNESGNMVLAGYSATAVAAHLLLSGLELGELDREIEKYLPFFRARRDADLWLFVRTTRQFGRNLQGLTASFDSLDDEEFSEADSVRALERGDHGETCHCWFFITKLRQCVFWGDFAGALAHSRRAERVLAGVPNTFYEAEYLFFTSLCLTALFETAEGADRKLFARQLQKHQKQMRKWARNCAANFSHKLLLVAAEMARVAKRGEEAGALFDAAIREARAAGFIHDEALANECAARFYRAQNRPQWTRIYAEEAHYLYEKWGAKAKARALEADFSLQKPFQAPPGDIGRTTDPLGTEKTSALDLATVIKAAQTLSGEIDLGRLLQRVLRFALENAGATRGFLILEHAGQLHLEAGAAVDDNEIRPQTLISQPLESSREVPLSVVQYVARTRENVVLHDATRDTLFGADPYITERQPKSVLCAPILGQNKLSGLIYLENGLTPGAFTPARLEVLKVLSAQAAISLQNARLYGQLEDYSRTLEQRVEARTGELKAKNGQLEQTLRDLQEMQARVIVQEKMASLGALTAGIAHEIKNPLNFVNNFAALSVELTAELEDELEALTQNLDQKTRDYLSEILGDLKSNAQKINEHGGRADSIVRNMLLHSRGQSSQSEATDLNALVREAVQLAYHGQRAGDSSFNVSLQEDYADLPPVQVLPHELSRVILNLANNAFYATSQKARRLGDSFSPTLWVSTLQSQGTEIRIKDNGEGIPDEVRARIFTPFFTTKPTGEGTGLGLSMSYDIVVQQHGGELRVQSTPGEGTEFLIVLP